MKYGKVDHVQAAIVKTLRKLGVSVTDLTAVGKGVPDLLVARAGKLYLLEIKDPKTGRLNPLQIDFHAQLQLNGVTVAVVHTIDEALIAIGLL